MTRSPTLRLVLLLSALALPVEAQSDSLPPPGACWRFAFGEWTPPLDWSQAGHAGDASAMATQMRSVRDSIFVRDTAAVNSNTMLWERTTRGFQLLLFPPWWPVGVLVTFDSTALTAREMTGEAVAMAADGSRDPSRARVRAQNTCRSSGSDPQQSPRRIGSDPS